MKQRKKQKNLAALRQLLTAGPVSGEAEHQDDLAVLEELGEELDVSTLKAYMAEQRRVDIEAESIKIQKRESANPYKKLPTDRIVELIQHKNKVVAQGAQLELARRNFFYFCHLNDPVFYSPDRPHIVRLCNELQEFYQDKDEMVMVVNMPPRHGKSRTMGLFEQWVFGKYPHEKIMTGSYNETLSTRFSKTVRNGIQQRKADPDKIVFSDIFPGVAIQRGDAAMNLWSLEGQHESYLSTSPSGTSTGFGATLMVIDDLIKLAIEAFNESLLKAQWEWFTDTMFARLEEGGKIIIIMTRWASGDLAGRAIKHFRELGEKVRVLSMKALLNEKTHEMLCPQILSYKKYLLKTKMASQEIASANYQQIPIDLQGRLYQSFKTYDDIPRNASGKPLFTAIRAYCDTADTGSDYLCNIIYGEYLKEAYVLDVYYTRDPMEITETETARRLCEFGVRDADIESNNGGRGFARAISRILREVFRCFRCVVRWFHQSENKRARILTNASWVQHHIYFPADWKNRWPEYYEAMYKYQREGKNAHDDAPDATTGVAEHFNKSGSRLKIGKRRFGL